MKRNIRNIIVAFTIIFTMGLLPMAQSANASGMTVLDQADMVRFMYWLINGPPGGTYPDGHGGPDGGFLGMIRELTGPTALGGGLADSGYSNCTDIPATGSASMTDSEGTFNMTFGTPQKTIPTGWTGAGGNYDKKVTVALDGTTFMDIEFNCVTEAGWLRFAEPGETQATARHIEIYYDTTVSAASKLELYMYYEAAGTDSENSSLQNEYFAAKFTTAANGVYSIWITRAAEEATTQGFRIAINGSTALTGGVASAYMLMEDGSYSNASTGTTTDTDSIMTGDLGCVNFNSGAAASADSTCSANSLAAAEAGTPISDSIGDFSINWVASTMKDNMSTLD